MELLSRIKQANLSNTEKQAMQVITSRLHRTAFLSGPELAQECSVSTSAITRLAQKIGYEGFPDFKRDLQELYRKTITPYEVFESFLAQSEKESISSKSMVQDVDNLKSLSAQLDDNQLERATSWLDDAEKIYLVGIAASEALVDLAAAYFETLGKTCVRLKGFGITKQVELIKLNKKDALVAFSSQRILREIRDTVDLAKRGGCRTIAITDSPINPLAVSADCVLIAPVTGTTFGASLVAPLAMINLLSNALAARSPKKSLQQLRKAKEVWEDYPIFCQ